jgi:hypothetical protein
MNESNQILELSEHVEICDFTHWDYEDGMHVYSPIENLAAMNIH